MTRGDSWHGRLSGYSPWSRLQSRPTAQEVLGFITGRDEFAKWRTAMTKQDVDRGVESPTVGTEKDDSRQKWAEWEKYWSAITDRR